MSLINAETRSKIFVLLIISGCVGAAILLGVLIFELPWKPSDNELLAKAQKSSPLTAAQVENNAEAVQKLENIQNSNSIHSEKAEELLKIYPVIDGHNDLAWNLRNLIQNDLRKFNFTQDLTQLEPWRSHNESFTDIPRLRKGRVGAQFWVAYTNCESQWKDGVVQAIEQIDVIHRLVEEYPDHLKFCTTAQCIIDTSFNKKEPRKIASLIGVEGGHLIQSSPGVLRQFYGLGVRYLTLTHSCNTPWADSSTVDDPSKSIHALSNGLSQFGLELIDEMNRLGMMIDLSHVSEATMIAALKRSKAPVIFSHSGAKAICNIHRNVNDEVLRLLKVNNGVIMINFYSDFIYCDKEVPRMANLLDVVRHIEHIRDTIGVDHIGLGGDYDGVNSMPLGLEDVSKYPNLFAALIERDWKLTDLKKISFTNIVRVMESVENVKNMLANQAEQKPMQSIIPEDELKAMSFPDGGDPDSCLSSKALGRLLDKEKLTATQQNVFNQTKHSAKRFIDDDINEEKITNTATATTTPKTATLDSAAKTSFTTTDGRISTNSTNGY